MQAGRRVRQQRRHGIVHDRVGHQVVVIEDDDDVRAAAGDVVDEHRQHITDHVRPRRVEDGQRPTGQSRHRLRGGQQQVAPESVRIIVAGIDAHPAGRHRRTLQPLGDHRALPPARWGHDQGERNRQRLVERVEQSLAADRRLPEPRRVQLGRHHDIREPAVGRTGLTRHGQHRREHCHPSSPPRSRHPRDNLVTSLPTGWTHSPAGSV